MSDNAYSKTSSKYPDYRDDEIDLMELVAVLWGGKWLVIGLVFLSAVFTFCFLKFFADSYYSVDVVIDKPSNYQLQRLQPSELQGGKAYQVAEIDLETIYSRVLSHADSLFVKRLFWRDHVMKSGEKMTDNEMSQDKEFQRFAKELRVNGPSGKEPEQTRSTLAIEVISPEAGIALVTAYQEFISTYTLKMLAAELRAGYEASLFSLDEDYISLENRELQKLDDELIVLTEALEIARALGIKETSYDQVENVELKMLDDKRYLLGSRVLNEEIKSLEARKEKPLAAFSVQLRNMENWKRQVESDLKQLDNIDKKVMPFVVVSPPESSLKPVKPNKLMILIGVIFLSGMLGVIIVFVRHGMKSYQERANQDEAST
ncbi:MAG: hypothetical protein K6L75_02130 [Cellvibrionaceae bacterium]